MTASPSRRARRPPFERVVAQHGQVVLRFCAAQVGAERAEDCFQETMLAALRAYDQVRDPDAIRGWLLSIAANKAVDLHRARARTPVPIADAADAVDTATAPVDAALLRDAALWDRVRALPPKQRQALALRYVGDLTHREIAAAMGTSEEAARRSVFEAVSRLRKDVHAA